MLEIIALANGRKFLLSPRFSRWQTVYHLQAVTLHLLPNGSSGLSSVEHSFAYDRFCHVPGMSLFQSMVNSFLLKLYIQGVQQLLPQLWLGIFSVNVDGIQCPFNHLMSTWGDFVWHMKHHGTFNGLQDTDENTCWLVFPQNWLFSPTSHSKKLELRYAQQYHLLLFLGLIFMQNKCSCMLIWEHFVNSNFCQKGH